MSGPRKQHDRYRRIELLGEGGCGRVWLVEDRERGNARLALKELIEINPDRVDTLRREFATLTQLRHPGLVEVLELDSRSTAPRFTMEHVRGRNIVAAVESEGADLFLQVAVEALRTLGFLHDFGLIHRDLKPANLLVRDQAVLGWRLAVLDFGLALRGGERDARASTAGTFPYMAPELFDEGAATPRSDLYALGAVLFEAVHGRPPFDPAGKTFSTLVEMVRAGKRPRPAVPAGFPSGLGAWLDEMLAPDAADRPGGARESLARLGAISGTSHDVETPETRASRLASGPPPGRAAETEELWAEIATVETTSRPRVVWLRGEEGSGKTRLLRWLRGEAVTRGWSLLEAAATGSEKLDAAAVVESARERAKLGSTVLLIDQIESAATGVVRLVERVAREPKRPPLCVVAAVRTADVRSPELTRLIAQTGVVPSLGQVQLDPLDDAAVREMAERATGSRSISGSKLRWLCDASEGNAAFVEALLVEGTWEKGARQAMPSLGGSYAARLDRLGDDARRWLVALSVLGEGTSDEIVSDVAGIDRDRGRRAARTLAAAELARERDGLWSPASRRLGSEVLGRVDAHRRRAVHRAAAERAEAGSEDTDPMTLARLWSGADAPDLAVRRAVEAADLAERRGDVVGALEPLAFALRQLGRRDERRSALRLRHAESLRRAGRYMASARAWAGARVCLTDGGARAEARARQARMLAFEGRFDRAMVIARLALEESTSSAAARALAEETIGIVLSRLGKKREALPYLQRAIEVFGEIGDTSGEATAMQALATTEANEGMIEALGHYRDAIKLHERAGHRSLGLASRTGLASVLQQIGEYGEAKKELDEAGAISVREGNQAMEGTTSAVQSRRAVVEGSYTEAIARGLEAEEQGSFLGDTRLLLGGRYSRILALVGCGRAAEAANVAAATLKESLEKADPIMIEAIRLAAIESRLQTNPPRSLARELESRLDLARRFNDPEILLWALVVEIERRASSPDESVDEVRQELDELFGRGGLWKQPHYVIRADLASARSCLTRNDPEAGRKLAERAAKAADDYRLPELGARAFALIGEAHELGGNGDGAAQANVDGRDRLRQAAERIEDPEQQQIFLDRSEFRRLRRPTTRGGTDDRRVLALYEMIRVLNKEMDPDALLPTILDLTLEVLRAQRGMIFLRDPATGGFSVCHARNLEKETEAAAEAFSRSIVAQAGAGKAILALDAGRDERFQNLESVSLYGIHSLMCVPLRSRGEIVGTVYIDSRQKARLFSQDDLRFVEAFADHAALALENARARERLLDENRQLRQVAATRLEFGKLIGRCPAMQRAFALLEKVSASEFPVLIQGESGTGKELAARAIHFNGLRSRKSFVSENCSAIPETLLQSELFGHVRGAFTGAERDHAGLFEQADDGTLFLDEIGDMSAGMQAQLLRVLQEGEVRRVGGNRPIKVDVRILAATHRNLPEEVRAGRFRADLMYRLQVLVVPLPPLRERPGDVALLVDHFLDRTARARGRPKSRITGEVLDALERYPWPGNVRQLENTIQRLCVLAGDGPIERTVLESDATLKPLLEQDTKIPTAAPYSLVVREKEQIAQVLAAAEGNRTHAARMLGISRATIYRKIKEYGL